MEIIDDDISIIKRVANFWSYKAGRDKDELESVAATAILEARTKEPKNRNQYIAKMSRNAIIRFLSEVDISIKVPLVSRQRLSIVDRSRKTHEPKSQEMGPEQYVMLVDSLLVAAKTPMEKAYIQLRIDGLTNYEAVAKLDSNNSEASRMLRAIEERFEADWYE